ncbi:MAG: esterase [Acidobacteria bacterium]|nr:esterase [Acidobacteriota bacterium]
MRRSVLAVVLVSATIAAGMAQNPPGRGGRGFGGGAVRSPEVAADGRVTFRLRAPNAKEVFVTGIGQRLAMEKNEQGIWSVTTEPMKPDIYTYSFSVDGATFNDPGNGTLKSSFNGAGPNILTVPGDVTWEPGSNLPRGTVAHHFYHSAIAGDDRDYFVYTPANYDPKRKEPYPTLYLLHGLGDKAGAWTDVGAANVILDNLIAQGKAKPMVMVNTLGYGNSGGPSGAMSPDMLPAFVRTVLEEVMPKVEKDYHVSKDRSQRAIAGLSMGGAEATLAGLNHLDKFAWIGSFSGAYVMWPRPPAANGSGTAGRGAEAAANGRGRGGRGPASLDASVIEKNFPNLDAKANSRISLLWIACGDADSLVGVNRNFRDWLNAKGVKLTYTEIPGMAHVWPLWRQNLTELAPLLFRAK